MPYVALAKLGQSASWQLARSSGRYLIALPAVRTARFPAGAAADCRRLGKAANGWFAARHHRRARPRLTGQENCVQ